MAMKKVWALIAGLVFGLAAGSVRTPADELVDGVAAYVNENAITVGEVKQAIGPLRRRLASAYEGEELQSRLGEAYEKALKALVEEKLILDAYEREENKVPEQALESRIDVIQKSMFEEKSSDFMEALRAENMTYEDWREEMRENLIVNVMRNEYVETGVEVSPSEIQAFYEENREKFEVPGEVKLRMIVLKAGGGASRDAIRRQAQEILRELEAGKDFAVIARRQSEGNMADKGGDWGWIDPSILRPELAAAAARLQPGEISSVIETREEFYIIRVEGRKDVAAPSFAEVEERIEKLLRHTKSEALYEKWVAGLRKKAYVRVFEHDIF
ncbi:MAG: peptidyl-prolyl cis-trans isomerase [Kiritimatiellia bacterium]